MKHPRARNAAKAIARRIAHCAAPACAFAFLLAAFLSPAHAQAPEESAGRGVVLVLPFQDKSQQPNLEWMAEAFPVIINQRLESAGFLAITREERSYALDRLGLPAGLHPSRATAYRLAEEMDADFVVLGNYSTQNGNLILETSVLDVHHAHMPAPMRAQNQLANLLELGNVMAWRTIKQMDPAYSVSQASFLAAVPQVRLDAFENYVRGIMTTSAAERIHHLETATQLSPDFVPARYQLGRACVEAQQYEKAIVELQRVPADHPLAMQAAFYLAQAQFSTGKYAQAEQTFSFIASRLPLPEVLNNQGVATARQGKNGTPLFQQAVTADPKDEDFHFNLAVALWRSGDFRQATREIDAALALRPADADAKDLQSKIVALQRDHGDEQTEPLERLKRDFNESTIRQAAFALEQLELAKLGSQPADKRAAAEVADGDRYFAQGLLLEAEQSYQTALHTDSENLFAHSGLANAMLKTGDLIGARAEADASLKIAPSALAYVVLGNVQMDQNQLPAAASSASQALHLQPQDKAARLLQLMLQRRGVSVP